MFFSLLIILVRLIATIYYMQTMHKIPHYVVYVLHKLIWISQETYEANSIIYVINKWKNKILRGEVYFQVTHY